MNRAEIANQRHAADQMETVALLASVIGAVAAVLIFLSYGLLAGLLAFLVSFLCFGLSRVFDLISGRFACLQLNAPPARTPPVQEEA